MELRLDGNDWRLTHLLPSEWVWRQVWREGWEPHDAHSPVGYWIPGSVPGDVIADSLDARLIPNPYQDLNSRACEWLSERDWVYQKLFTVPPDWRNKTVRLRFDGVDHTCHVYLNGSLLGDHEGMFLPFEFDVTPHLRHDLANDLRVIVEHKPPVEVVQGQIGWTNRARVWKSRFTYNWDWCTRLVPVGIWQSVRLLATGSVWLGDVWVQPKVQERPARVQIHAELKSASLEVAEVRLRLTIRGPQGQVVAEREAMVEIGPAGAQATLECEIPDPQWWFPNGMGDQPLYQARLEVFGASGRSSDVRLASFGLRSLRAIPNEGAATDALPYTLEVNGRRLFVKGWNWSPIDNLYGRPQVARYERLLSLAHHAHCNLLRVWGGGLLEREEFYHLCDRLGILVWQEFHHSSSGIQNAPPEDEEYLNSIEVQARQMVPLRRNHPSLAIWCGGNELMDDAGVPLTDAHPALARLKSVVQALDPDRLWLPTSASGPVEGPRVDLAGSGQMHDVHGPWNYQGPEEHYRLYNTIDPLYHSEFGVEGAANMEVLQQFISPRYHFPPDGSNPVWVHHGAWWLHREKLEALFGPLRDIETFVRASQWMQAEGLRYALEANRRRKWHCSGTSPWQFAEAFPNTACTNVVDFLGLPKPAYWWARRAYEPQHISLRYDRLTWEAGHPWQAQVWVNNSLAASPGCRWTAEAVGLNGKRWMQAEGTADLPANAALKVGDLRHEMPYQPAAMLVVLTLRDVQDRLLSRNEYVFSSAQPPLQPLLEAPSTTLSVWQQNNELSVRNAGGAVALLVQLTPPDARWLLLEDDYFSLLPGETRVLRLPIPCELTVRAWNSKPHRVRFVTA